MSNSRNIFVGFLAVLLKMGLAEASPITAYANPLSSGAQVTLTRSGGLDTVRTTVQIFGWWNSNTVAFSPDMRVGETLYQRVDSGDNHFINSFIIRSTTNTNYPADAFLSPDTKKSTSLSINHVNNFLGIPDTCIDICSWLRNRSQDTASTKVGRGKNTITYHDVVLGFQPIDTIMDLETLDFILKYTRRDTTFQTKGFHVINKAFDGNAIYKEFVDFPVETIPPTNILEEKLLHKDPHPTATFVRQFNPRGFYDASGRKANYSRTGVYFNPNTRRKIVCR
jgi:hypothetical protein